MPGTIHVSVMDFKDLPSSSPPSSILVKVSMGKKEYRTWDKGDFFFPVTTLRENVSITLQDSKGNEISHTGVQTMLVVEKGTWDEFLPLGGGGQVHMKLHFVLSEEERNRIRIMRESAMKKKSDELLNRSLRCSETASTTVGTATSSSCVNHKNDTDGIEQTSSAASTSKRKDLHLGDVNYGNPVDKIETKLHHLDLSKRPTFSQEASSTPKKNLLASELKNDPANQREMQDSLERTHSNDMRPGIKPTAAKPSNKVGLEAPKDLNSKEITKSAKLTSGRLSNPFLTGELQQIQTYEIERELHIGFDKDLKGSISSQDTGQLKEPSPIKSRLKETESVAKNELRKPQEDLIRMSVVEVATFSRSMHEQHSGFHQPHNLMVNQQDSGGAVFIEGKERGIHLTDSLEIDIQGSSEDKLKSVAFWENEHSSSESSGAWIFPDHTRQSCMTTEREQVMELIEGCGIQERSHKGNKSFSLPENVEKHSMQFGNYSEVKESDETLHEPRKSRIESSAEAETSTGPVGQVIKVAIMIAFGALILLTRQRNPR